MKFELQPLGAPDQLDLLAEEARRQGYRMLDRLQQEWREGINRFDREGECVLIAVGEDRIVGVCGLNRDPYCSLKDIGRVRRLYVASGVRRRGVGRLLVEAIQQRCPGVFQQLRLRTNSSAASTFYQALGFRPVEDEPDCTHVWTVSA
ncbi:GNAT family N-acetyltransferase [Gimesia chilikensis]|uniref:Acetyltransferase n=1 Tax=Gimesia chilikensis TaxID=2605989 RepID=A0A517PRR4_9PLAN|nr:GNAT family N-acetyltransferase [Gimesia chilikensis]QDT22062.1 acetyltransferase [Gimesia chilikensis]